MKLLCSACFYIVMWKRPKGISQRTERGNPPLHLASAVRSGFGLQLQLARRSPPPLEFEQAGTLRGRGTGIRVNSAASGLPSAKDESEQLRSALCSQSGGAHQSIPRGGKAQLTSGAFVSVIMGFILAALSFLPSKTNIQVRVSLVCQRNSY